MLYQVIEDGQITESYSMPDHDDDHHIGSAKRNGASGIAGLNASSELINTVPFTVLKEPNKQSFINLMENGDFESWSAGTANKPDGWTGGVAAVARNSSPKYNTYCLALTKSGSSAHLSQIITNYSDYLGTIISFGVWVKTSTVNQGLILIETGAGNITSSFHSGSGDWEFLIATGTLPAGATSLNLHCRVHNTDGTVYFDGAIMVKGSICPAFSPKPISKSDLSFRGITSVSVNTTLTDTHYTVNVDATDGARTITLPAAATNSGRIYNIKKIDSSVNAVIIDGNGAETIDGAATQTLAGQWDNYTIQCNGTEWFII